MRKLTAMFVVFVLLIMCSPSFGSVGIRDSGRTPEHIGTATDFKFSKIGGSLSNDGSTFTFNLILAGMANSGATSMTTSTLAVPVTHGYVRKAIANDSAFTAGTLADGTPGQLLTIHIVQQDGSEVFTVTPTTATGWATLGFDAVGEIATLWYVDDTTGWVIFGNTNATLTLP